MSVQKQTGTAIAIPIGTIYANDGGGYARPMMEDVAKTLRAEGQPTSVVIRIREATKQGYAEARGGETPSISQCQTAEQDADASG